MIGTVLHHGPGKTGPSFFKKPVVDVGVRFTTCPKDTIIVSQGQTPPLGSPLALPTLPKLDTESGS